MPFHEIREITFADRFNSVWDRRRQSESSKGTRKRLSRGQPEGRRIDPNKEIDIWA